MSPAENAGGRLVAVNGASGFIGRHVVTDLAARGYAVRAIVRRPAMPAHSAAAESVVADLRDRGAVARAFAGAHAVVHVAGQAHVLDRRAALDDFRRANVDVARACAEAAGDAGVGCFVAVSSLAAIAPNIGGRVDDATLAAPVTDYGRSKLEGEAAVLAVARTAGLRAPILRPPMVYGPGMRGNPLRLFRLVARGLPIPLGAVENQRSILYVGNLTAAIAVAIERPTVTSEPFLVADTEAVSTADLVRRIGRSLGRPARLIPVPVGLLRLAAVLGDVASRVMPMPLTSRALEGLVGTLVVDDARFRRLGAFHPPYTLDAGLQRTAEWFLAAEVRR